MVLPVILVSNDWLRGFNRGFSIFFNIEKLLFCFTKLCKCAHKKNVSGYAPPPERLKIWHVRGRGYLIFYWNDDHVTWYTYRLCCPDCNNLPL